MSNILKPNYEEGSGFYKFESVDGAQIVLPSTSIIFVDDEADERYIVLKSAETRNNLYLLQRP